MTWDEIGRDSLYAGRLLMKESRWRSSVSRSYYAAFSVIVGRLLRRMNVPARMMTPRQDALPAAVMRHLTALYPKQQRTISRLLLRLYRERLNADYNAKQRFDRVSALDSMRMTAAIFKLLEVEHG